MLRLPAVVFLWCCALVSPAAAQGYIVTPAPIPGGPDTVSRYAGADGGRLVFSFAGGSAAMGLIGAGSMTYGVYFRRLDQPGNGFLSGSASNFLDPTFREGASTPEISPVFREAGLFYPRRSFQGTVVNAKLPPGKYEVTAIRVHSPYLVQSVGPLAIPFEIAPGRATYLGELRAFELRRKSALNLLHGWNVVLTDQSARDLPLLIAKRKDFDWTQADVRVPAVANQHQPLLNARP